MKRIWFVSHYSMPPEYEMRIKTQMFARYFQDQGVETKIFSASTIHNTAINLIADGSLYIEREYEGLNFVHIRCENYTGNGLKRIINMRQFARRFPRAAKNFPLPDVIVADVNCVNYKPIARFCRKHNIKFYVDVRDLWPLSMVEYRLISEKNPLTRYLYRQERRMYTVADGLIFAMEGGLEYLAEKGWDTSRGGPVDPAKVFHINNGVDMEAFAYNREHHPHPDEHLDDPELFTAVYVGSIRTVNAVDQIVEAAVLTKDPRIRYLIWGDGDQAEGLKKRCADEQITNVVFKGFTDKREIPSIVSRAGVNLLNSGDSGAMRFGGSLNKMFDYFAAGKPVIQNFSMAHSLIEKYNCGIIVEHTSEAMAAAVERVSEMPADEYARYCENAKKAAGDFDYRLLAEKLAKIVDNS
ncbi:MAG: glycosyltransferase family 4 protein [Oscillospiraceae bacterium]|nr:glycosyltransferase family 4 protein [Oscillospiraceae bacterium]